MIGEPVQKSSGQFPNLYQGGFFKPPNQPVRTVVFLPNNFKMFFFPSDVERGVWRRLKAVDSAR